MREILFRGEDEFGWLYGDLVHTGNKVGIKTSEGIFIVPDETIGQYTGLCDKRGNRIFEGDIVRITGFDYLEKKDVDYIARVVYLSGGFCAADGPLDNYAVGVYALPRQDLVLEVIGNIYDNTELLEVEQ